MSHNSPHKSVFCNILINQHALIADSFKDYLKFRFISSLSKLIETLTVAYSVKNTFLIKKLVTFKF